MRIDHRPQKNQEDAPTPPEEVLPMFGSSGSATWPWTPIWWTRGATGGYKKERRLHERAASGRRGAARWVAEPCPKDARVRHGTGSRRRIRDLEYDVADAGVISIHAAAHMGYWVVVTRVLVVHRPCPCEHCGHLPSQAPQILLCANVRLTVHGRGPIQLGPGCRAAGALCCLWWNRRRLPSSPGAKQGWRHQKMG